MSKFHLGDKVDITIKGATVTYCADDGMDASYSTELGAHELTSIALDSDAVTVERVTEEVKPGDLYRDDDGDHWLVTKDGDMRSTVDAISERDVEHVRSCFGPLTRVYRVEDAEVTA